MNTFADLTHLRWLDLSDNHLRHIPRRAFYGLTLQHLFLNGNRDIRLLPGSFSGLVTSGLYLHDCALRVLLPSTLSPLNGTLVNLWLNGNRLTGVDRRLSPVFSQLSHLRLGANPLHCGCETLWLKQLYDSHGAATFRGAEPPTCSTPDRLRARHFDQFTSDEFHCSPPSFGNIDAVLDWQGTGRLRCTANGQPAPTIYWIRLSGRTRRFDVGSSPSNSVSSERRDNEGVVLIDHGEGLYVCVARNEVGNVTLTVNLSWSGSHGLSSTSPPAHRHSLILLPTLSHSLISVDGLDASSDQAGYLESGQEVSVVLSDEVRLFSVSQLVAAVIGTHLATVMLFLVVLIPVQLVRRARRRQHSDSLPVRQSLLDKSTTAVHVRSHCRPTRRVT